MSLALIENDKQDKHNHNDLSVYMSSGGACATEFDDLSTLEPTIFMSAMHTDANDDHGRQCGAHKTVYTPAKTAMHHCSPTGSAGHTSTHSDDSEEVWRARTHCCEQAQVLHIAWAHAAGTYMPANSSAPVGYTYERVACAQPSSAPSTHLPRTTNNLSGKVQKKRKPKRDPNEPQKPVSAYALFFRDTQATIKGQNPNASFGEVSKIVASMWDSLNAHEKSMYKLRTETAKKDYLRQLAGYRANLLSNGTDSMNCTDFLAATAHAQPSGELFGRPTPDSTTQHGDRKDGCSSADATQRMHAEANSYDSLASLIAQPQPQRVLTATTTLTVPHAYPPSQPSYSKDMHQQWQQQQQQQHASCEFRPTDGLVAHCR